MSALCKRSYRGGVGRDRPAAARCRKRLDARERRTREVVNAILYMARTGCQWRMLPN